MLVEKPKKTDTSIISIKFVSGEEIIAEKISDDKYGISIKHPLTLVMTMPLDGGDQGQVAFAPWILGIDANEIIKLKADHIQVTGTAREDAAHQYREALKNSGVH